MSTRQEIIQPLDNEQQQLVIQETQAYIKQANDLFKIKNASVDITFNLKGRAAGMYRVKRKILTQAREIRYNPFIFEKYFDDNFKTTIPHEVAHYVSDLIYGLKNIKPHGKEWKEIMQAFGADASVTANYDLTGIPRQKRTLYTYHCACREHQVGAIRHNRIKKQQGKYICNFCKKALYVKQATTNVTV
jgi:SprT protein